MADGRKPETRPLTASERALLDHLLTPEFAGVDSLRSQATQAEAVVQDEYPWHIDLWVPSTAPPATNVSRNPITRTVSANPTPTDAGADITLWLHGDYLRRIEVMWFDEARPEPPPPTELDEARLM